MWKLYVGNGWKCISLSLSSTFNGSAPKTYRYRGTSRLEGGTGICGAHGLRFIRQSWGQVESTERDRDCKHVLRILP